MTEPPTTRTFYGELTYEHVKNIIAPYLRGADEEQISEFLAEAELDVANEIGPLAATLVDEGTPDLIIRAVVRDLAGARTILKLVGSDNDEGRRAGQALHEYAWERLVRWQEYHFSSQSAENGTGNVHNIFPAPLFNDPRAEGARRLGGEWPQA